MKTGSPGGRVLLGPSVCQKHLGGWPRGLRAEKKINLSESLASLALLREGVSDTGR